MISIDVQTRGRFGNKIFHFNNLMQLSNLLNQSASCDNWDGYGHFEKICPTTKTGFTSDYSEIPFDDLCDLSTDVLREKYSKGDWKLHTLSLHGPFHRLTAVDPRNFFIFNQENKIDSRVFAVGIHIRGGDTRGADGMNGREIHGPEYYIQAIEFILSEYKDKNIVFFVCTDDPDENYPSYQKTMDYLKYNNLHVYHKPASYIEDFCVLSECDVLISGSSTFVLAAGFVGKHKKIIHSEKFVNQFKDSEEKWYSSFRNGLFFKDLLNQPNQYYPILKLI